MRDVAVVGGGPAGAAAAITLAQAGRDVVLFERTAGPHDKVCGEFLSTEALDALSALGVDPFALGAVPIGRMQVTAGRQAASCALPFPAASLSRRVMDEALLTRAAALGVDIRRGATVRRAGPGHVDGVPARTVVLATGKHDLHGHPRPTNRPRWVGLKLHLRPGDPAAESGRTSVHLFDGGYAGLQPVEGGWANLCLATRDPALAAAGRESGGLLRAVLARVPALAPALAGAEPRWPRPLAVAGVPYGFLRAAPAQDGLFPLGDQFAAIPSFCGDGMAIALASARLAATAIIANQGSAYFHQALHTRLHRQFARAAWLSRLAANTPARHAAIAIARIAPHLLAAAAAATRLPDVAGQPRHSGSATTSHFMPGLDPGIHAVSKPILVKDGHAPPARQAPPAAARLMG